jgi:hypothetical protein
MSLYPKIIFLDIDGVLVCRPNGINSSWRRKYEYLSDLRGAIQDMGVLPGRIIDQTPVIPHNSSEIRGLEIQAWLDDNADYAGVEKFVIIDDGSDMAHLLPHLVQTFFADGLTEKESQKVIDILNS